MCAVDSKWINTPAKFYDASENVGDYARQCWFSVESAAVAKLLRDVGIG